MRSLLTHSRFQTFCYSFFLSISTILKTNALLTYIFLLPIRLLLYLLNFSPFGISRITHTYMCTLHMSCTTRTYWYAFLFLSISKLRRYFNTNTPVQHFCVNTRINVFHTNYQARFIKMETLETIPRFGELIFNKLKTSNNNNRYRKFWP